MHPIEAHFILLRAALRINDEMALQPIYTIHDNIATIRGESEIVRKVMMEEFKVSIGVNPKLKFEPWYSL